MGTDDWIPVDDFPIADIVRDPEVQVRKTLDREAIAEYADLVRSGQKPPRVRMFHDGQRQWLSRGFHRVESMLLAGGQYIDVEYRHGTRRDAILDCLSANQENGVRLTSEDKRRGIERLLTDAEWSKWSDRDIARHLRAPHGVVSRVRASLSQRDSDMPSSASSEGGRSESSPLSQSDSESAAMPDASRRNSRKRSKASSSSPAEDAGERGCPVPAPHFAEDEPVEASAVPTPTASQEPRLRKYLNRYGKEVLMDVSKIGKPGKAAGLPKRVERLLKSLPRHVSARRDSHRPTVFVVQVGTRAKCSYSATPKAVVGRLLQSPDVKFVGAAAGSNEDAHAVREALSAELGPSGWRTMTVTPVIDAMRRQGLDVVLLDDVTEEELTSNDAPASASPAALDATTGDAEQSTLLEGLAVEAQTPSSLRYLDSLDAVAAQVGRPLTKFEWQLLEVIDGALGTFQRVQELMHGRRPFQMPTVDIELAVTAGIKSIKSIKEIAS